MSMSWPVHWLAEIDSTNEEARRRAQSGALSGQWIAARRQISGRGRLGRTWVSPEGNLYATALFPWTDPVRAMTCIPFATALAVADTVTALAPEAVFKLKWPNDVRCDGAKISGVLIETGEAQRGRWVAVGIGINVRFTPEGLGQAATNLADLRGDAVLEPEMVLQSLREAFARRLAEAKLGFETILQAWLTRAEGLGETVRVTVNGEPVSGVFQGLGEDGALLLLLPDGAVTPIRAGDVELIREVSPD